MLFRSSGLDPSRNSEVGAAHLPRRHLAVVAGVRVVVPLDAHERRVGREHEARPQAVVVAPEARRQRDVAALVELVARRVAGAPSCRRNRYALRRPLLYITSF